VPASGKTDVAVRSHCTTVAFARCASAVGVSICVNGGHYPLVLQRSTEVIDAFRRILSEHPPLLRLQDIAHVGEAKRWHRCTAAHAVGGGERRQTEFC